MDDDVDLDVADVSIRQHSTASSDYIARVEDHAQLAYDFKGEAYTFKATAVGLLTHLSHCVDLMYQSEDMWRIKYDRQVDKRRQIDEKYKQIINQKNSEISALTSTRALTINQTCLMAPIMGATPDFEEGPHSAMRDEQFFDAIDSTLDNMDLEERRRLEAKNNLKAIEQLGKCRNDDYHHPLASTIKRIVDEHIQIDRQELTDIWELFASDGEMKLYRREIEDNGKNRTPPPPHYFILMQRSDQD
jgi:collagen type IV alpha-3-binding protein